MIIIFFEKNGRQNLATAHKTMLQIMKTVIRLFFQR